MPTSVTVQSGSMVRGNWAGKILLPMIQGRSGRASSIGYQQGVAVGSMTSINDDAPGGRHYACNVTQSLNDGFPASPCLSITAPGFWRFRWVVKPGPRAIYVWAQQNSTGSANRPSMVVNENPAVGLNYALSASAPDGQGWQQVGPITFTANGTGVVWVELHNNFYAPLPPAISASMFDHIITT
jgi:hypothetical protein